jgi:hypothetical protein
LTIVHLGILAWQPETVLLTIVHLGILAWQPVLLLLVLSTLECCSASGSNHHKGGRMAGLGLVPHGIDVANALAVADAQAGGQRQLIAGTQATIL